MHHRFISLMPVGILALSLLFATLAHAGPPPEQEQSSAGTVVSPFDPRDLTGTWVSDSSAVTEDAPPMTPEGEERIKENIPTRPTHPYHRALQDPGLSNDPTFECNPRGFPRITNENERMFEFIHLRDRLLQLFQRGRTLRELWTDGRELPSGENLDNIGPSWYGHSVGEWQGDEFVVNTVGLDDRAWLDFHGYVKSFEARIEEHYRRVGADTIEGRKTLYYPKV